MPYRGIGLLCVLLVGGCSDRDTDLEANQNVTASCTTSATDLAKLCPAGTAIDAHANASDPGACKTNTTSGEGGIETVCRVQGECAVECKVVLDCKCGASLISKEQVQCLKCTNCGNHVVEDGEQCDLGTDNGKGKGCDNNCQLTQGSCGNNGDLRCSQDSKEVQTCTDGIWTTKTACTSDETCDTGTYQCKTVPNYCPDPGGSRCVGDFQRQKCGADHRWADDPCPATAPKCSTTGGTVQCVAGEDVSVSANYRISRSQLVIGGMYGFGSSGKYQVHLGPVKK